LCERCEAQGKVEPATVVNHRIPHRGDQRLFWDRTNWEPACKPHHDSTIQAEERSGIVRGTDAAGRPLDPSHPWHGGRSEA
jgi:5-methylcytosine-specific restriction enzyme A